MGFVEKIYSGRVVAGIERGSVKIVVLVYDWVPVLPPQLQFFLVTANLFVDCCLQSFVSLLPAWPESAA